MTPKNSPPKSIAIIAHPQISDAFTEAAQITDYLREQKIHTASGLLYEESLRSRVKSGEFELMIALGGDGTLVRAGHLCGPSGIPVLGINVGHFGFLMEFGRDKWREMLPNLLAGDYWLEQRMMLRAEHHRADEQIGAWEVLNEVVVSRGQTVRPIQLTTYVDGYFLTTYVADGILAATPTGSTAYALAAGGPILPPELRNILIVAVAPHLSVDRAIVLAEGATVSITVHTTHQAVISIDGQIPISLADGDRVDVRASEFSVNFVRFQDRDYFYRNLTSHMNRNPSTGNH